MQNCTAAKKGKWLARQGKDGWMEGEQAEGKNNSNSNSKNSKNSKGAGKQVRSDKSVAIASLLIGCKEARSKSIQLLVEAPNLLSNQILLLPHQPIDRGE